MKLSSVPSINFFSSMLCYHCVTASFFVCFFLGPHPRHMEAPRLGVELKLQLSACTTAIVTPDPSCVCNLHHSSWQCQVLDPLREARDRTCILTDTSQVHFCCATMGIPLFFFFFNGFTHGMWKFLGQCLNPYHSTDIEFLTH